MKTYQKTLPNRMQDKTDALWKDLESITGATPSE